jgi:hypothetical protein
MGVMVKFWSNTITASRFRKDFSKNFRAIPRRANELVALSSEGPKVSKEGTSVWVGGTSELNATCSLAREFYLQPFWNLAAVNVLQ